MLTFGYFLLLVIDEAEVGTTTVASNHRNVAGYVKVRFIPEILRVSQGDTATGHVHVTVESHQFVDNSVDRRPSQPPPLPPLHACVVDQSIATASWSTADTDRRTDLTTCSLLSSVYTWESTDGSRLAVIYTVTVHGALIGRSAVRFYVIKTGAGSNDVVHNETAYNNLLMNDDLAVTPEDRVTSHNHVTAQVEALSANDQKVTQSNANVVSSDVSYAYRLSVNVTDSVDVKPGASYVISVTRRWWVADEYQIIVVSVVRRMTADVLSYLLLTFTAVNLIGVGGQFDCNEATQLVRRPSALAAGLFCRFAVMPAVSGTTIRHDHTIRKIVLFVLLKTVELPAWSHATKQETRE